MRITSKTTKRLCLASASCLAFGMPASAALAQDTGEATASSGITPASIIVTARRREETLLEAPQPISVYGADQLDALGVTDIVEIAELTPGFAMQNNSRQNEQPFIRGMSVNSFFPDNQKSSFFHDGVFVSGTSRVLHYNDVERIEVVKGPQAVYFGRQTFAGAINLVTKKPTFELEVQASAEYGEFDDYEFSAGISGPVTDTIAVRFFGQFGRDDGAFQNTLDAFRVQTEETLGGSASILFQPSADVSFVARAQIVEFDDGQNTSVLVGSNLNNCRPRPSDGVNQAFCGVIPTPDEVALNLADLEFPGGRRLVKSERYSLIGSVGFADGYEISTITAFNTEERINASDGDATPTAVFGFTFESAYQDFTQQIVLDSPQDQRLRWTLGAIYFDLERVESSLSFPFSSPSDLTKVRNIGIFGGGEFDITDRLTLGIEGRYSWDDIERIEGSPGPTLGDTLFQNTFKAFLPRFTLDYALSDEALLYAIVSKGNQPGGFNTGNSVLPQDQFVDEEEIWNYELGVRSQFADGRGLLAANAYYIDWSGQVVQATVPGDNMPFPTVVIDVNAGESRIYGLELEGSFEITDDLTVRATYAYIDSKYEDFVSNRPARFGGDPQVGGNRLQNTPEHMFSFAPTYSRKFNAGSDWGMFVSGILTYRSDQFLDETNTAKIGSATVVNAQLGVENDSWRITGFVRNLTNEDTPAFATIFSDFSRGFNPAYLTALREPRQFGVRVDFDY